MFQSFDEKADGTKGPDRLAALREAMRRAKVDAFIVPRGDAFQGEYVAPCDERLAWLTGFTGSAGYCIVTQSSAGVFVDGRYRLQVRAQVADVFTPVNWPETTLVSWICEQLNSGSKVAIDPWLHSKSEATELRSGLEKKNIELVTTDNLVDQIWSDRPDRPNEPFSAYPLEFSGKSSSEKRSEVAGALVNAEQRAAILTLPESIAWLLNIRGTDIEKNPVPQSFAILDASGRATLYAPKSKAAPVLNHLGSDITVRAPEDFLADVARLEGPVRIDPKSVPLVVVEALLAGKVAISEGDDPCDLPKAIKNPVELAGMREAHLRDGAAMCRFLHWLSENAPKGGVTEIDVVSALEGFRRQTNDLLDISFDTIAGTGPNGAVIHYRVTQSSNRELRQGDLIVVDSGGQYVDGTTDITRTIGIGTVGDDERHCYTRVLQGMIAISRARFPKGVTGAHLDALARAPLWAEGMDYNHGTGHGVGVYLCVHEGPQAISRRNSVPLEAGMILSNEPGYYRDGAFGIRIENLVAVTPPRALKDPGRQMMGFETLTFTPLDRNLISKDILSPDEIEWINAYHSDTLSAIGPRLDGAALDWLKLACAPI